MKYQVILTFVKHTNMLDYFDHNEDECLRNRGCNSDCVAKSMAVREYYAKERNVRLILMVRYDGRRTFCTIKCPINPLPVTGEFEVPNLTVMRLFLLRNGWKHHESLNIAGMMD